RRLAWHPELLALFGVEATTLPAIVPSIGSGAVIAHPDWGRELPLTAMACDQQAALFGHGGLREGTVKVTYGTGAFGVANIGSSARAATGLETSVGWTSADGPATYILQGGVLSAASFVNWARDTL